MPQTSVISRSPLCPDHPCSSETLSSLSLQTRILVFWALSEGPFLASLAFTGLEGSSQGSQCSTHPRASASMMVVNTALTLDTNWVSDQSIQMPWVKGSGPTRLPAPNLDTGYKTLAVVILVINCGFLRRSLQV